MRTKEQRKAAIAAYYANPEGKRCECGTVATVRVGKAWICARCARIQAAMAFQDPRGRVKLRTTEPVRKTVMEIMWETNWLIDGWERATTSCGYGSLELLERMMPRMA